MRLKSTYLFMLIVLFGCQSQQAVQDEATVKEAIINTLKKETQYFCERNLEAWQAQWSHQPFTYKMYAGNEEFEEFVGWEAINQFTIQHINENPNPIPLPDTNFEFEFHLFDETAWVFYSKNVDSTLVRETRFMVKEDKQWKIARMQTIF